MLEGNSLSLGHLEATPRIELLTWLNNEARPDCGRKHVIIKWWPNTIIANDRYFTREILKVSLQEPKQTKVFASSQIPSNCFVYNIKVKIKSLYPKKECFHLLFPSIYLIIDLFVMTHWDLLPLPNNSWPPIQLPSDPKQDEAGTENRWMFSHAYLARTPSWHSFPSPLDYIDSGSLWVRLKPLLKWHPSLDVPCRAPWIFIFSFHRMFKIAQDQRALVECGECARAWHIPSRGSMRRLTAGSLTWMRAGFYTLMRCAVLLAGHARWRKCCLRVSVHPSAKKEVTRAESLSVPAKKQFSVSAKTHFQGWD